MSLKLPEKSENRRKIDCFLPSVKVNSNATTREGSLHSDSACNVRNSLAWDSAFFTSPGVLDPEELFGDLNFRDMETGIRLPEPEIKNRISDASIRKSLAWDQAFFTSQGVLDHEELSWVNQGFLKSELPVIKEEMQRSGESNSTAESSDLSLSSLELDLFDDMRASLNKNSSTLALESRMRGDQNIYSSKKLDVSSKSRMRPTPPSRNQCMNTNTQGSQKIKSLCSQKQVSQTRDAVTVQSKKSSFGDLFRATPPHRPNESPGFRFSSSDSGGKSTPKYLRRKKDPRLTPTSASLSATPLRKLARMRSKLVNSSPINLLSTPRSAPASSNTSSLGSSTSRTRRSQNSATKLNLISPFKGVCCNAEPSIVSNSSSRGHGRSREQELLNCDFKTPTTPSPVSSSNNKPSNLRMPSPKIGYFDVENNVTLLPYRGLKFQSGVPGTSKVGSGTGKVDGAANRTRHSKHTKLGSQPAGTPCSPSEAVRLEEKSRKRSEDEGTKRAMKKKMSRISDEQVQKHEYDKEYVSGFKDEVDDLSRKIEAIDLGKDLVIEF